MPSTQGTIALSSLKFSIYQELNIRCLLTLRRSVQIRDAGLGLRRVIFIVTFTTLIEITKMILLSLKKLIESVRRNQGILAGVVV